MYRNYKTTWSKSFIVVVRKGDLNFGIPHTLCFIFFHSLFFPSDILLSFLPPFLPSDIVLMSTPNNPRPTGNERWRRIRAPYFTEGPVTFNNYILSTSGQLHNNRGRELQSSPGDRPTRYLLRDPNQRLDAAGIPRRLYVVLAELVLYTFSDNAPPIILPIRHIDGDTRNNGLYNLEFDFQGGRCCIVYLKYANHSFCFPQIRKL